MYRVSFFCVKKFNHKENRRHSQSDTKEKIIEPQMYREKGCIACVI